MSVMSNFFIVEVRFWVVVEMFKVDFCVDFNLIVVIGYCFGGGVVLLMVNIGMEDFDVVVFFYGSLVLFVMLEEGKVNIWVLVCNGVVDLFVIFENIVDYIVVMDKVQVDYKFINYEGVKYFFISKEVDVNGEKFGLLLVYNEEVDKKFWEEMKVMFVDVFGQ